MFIKAVPITKQVKNGHERSKNIALSVLVIKYYILQWVSYMPLTQQQNTVSTLMLAQYFRHSVKALLSNPDKRTKNLQFIGESHKFYAYEHLQTGERG